MKSIFIIALISIISVIFFNFYFARRLELTNKKSKKQNYVFDKEDCPNLCIKQRRMYVGVFSVRTTPDKSGKYRVKCHCAQSTTKIVKNLYVDHSLVR